MAKKSKISVIAFADDDGTLLMRRGRKHSPSVKIADGPCLWVSFIGAFCACVLMLELLLRKSQEPIQLPPVSSPCLGNFVPEQREENFALPSVGNLTDEEKRFWEQPDDLGYRPCLNFSSEYLHGSVGQKKRFLMVVVNGGLNQQRNQIVDAVVIARILEATLVVPVLQVNVVWEDESEFSDIFDVEHFKKTLRNDVRIVTSLPSTHLLRRPLQGIRMPFEASPEWIRTRLRRQLRRDGVLLLKGLDSRLSRDLPADLQKLRCKVAFQALKFAKGIESLGNRLADRMSKTGPYMALHLRLEKDVWVRTGCNPGLKSETDEIMIQQERKARPYLLTSRRNMTASVRRLAGFCPLNAAEVARLLKALGASSGSNIYWAGGEPLGGKMALQPLKQSFPNLYNKYDIAVAGELDEMSNRASVMAAVDYIVALRSTVFMASHGGNMGRAVQGHRAFAGHRKHITPNKREIIQYMENATVPDQEFSQIMRDLHVDSMGQPSLRTEKQGRDVLAYPVPECMCRAA